MMGKFGCTQIELQALLAPRGDMILAICFLGSEQIFSPDICAKSESNPKCLRKSLHQSLQPPIFPSEILSKI